MSHHGLCPKRKAIYKKCQCSLIDKVVIENTSLIEVLSPDHEKNKTRWYYSGRQDAAEEIEDLMHDDPCYCDFCAVLAVAYKAALGVYRGGS
jgi:hypothetical protein